MHQKIGDVVDRTFDYLLSGRNTSPAVDRVVLALVGFCAYNLGINRFGHYFVDASFKLWRCTDILSSCTCNSRRKSRGGARLRKIGDVVDRTFEHMLRGQDTYLHDDSPPGTVMSNKEVVTMISRIILGFGAFMCFVAFFASVVAYVDTSPTDAYHTFDLVLAATFLLASIACLVTFMKGSGRVFPRQDDHLHPRR